EHVPGETEALEPLEELGTEALGASQPIDLIRAEGKRLEIVEHLLQSGRDEGVARIGKPSDEELENGDFLHAEAVIGIGHRELIVIAQQRRSVAPAARLAHMTPPICRGRSAVRIRRRAFVGMRRHYATIRIQTVLSN